MMAVALQTEENLTYGSPTELFTGQYSVSLGRNYDIAPDGQRFLMIKEAWQTTDNNAFEITVHNP